MYNEVAIWIFFFLFVQQTRIANRLYLRNFNEKVLHKLTLNWLRKATRISRWWRSRKINDVLVLLIFDAVAFKFTQKYLLLFVSFSIPEKWGGLLFVHSYWGSIGWIGFFFSRNNKIALSWFLCTTFSLWFIERLSSALASFVVSIFFM